MSAFKKNEAALLVLTLIFLLAALDRDWETARL